MSENDIKSKWAIKVSKKFAKKYDIIGVDKARGPDFVTIGYYSAAVSSSDGACFDIGTKIVDKAPVKVKKPKIEVIDEIKKEPKMKTKLPTTFGFELTYILNYDEPGKEFSDDYQEDIEDKIGKLELKIKKSTLSKYGSTYINDDDYAIEINTPTFEYYEDIINYWSILNRMCRNLGLIVKHPTVGNGGGHIHIGYKPIMEKYNEAEKYKFIKALFTYFQNRPYLNWFFNEWCDTENANPIFEKEQLRRLEGKMTIDEFFNTFMPNVTDRLYRVYDGHKDNHVCLRKGKGTFEFRIFDGIDSLDILKFNIQYITDVINYLKDNLKYHCSLDVTVNKKSDLKKFARDDYCIERFDKDISKLNFRSKQSFSGHNLRKLYSKVRPILLKNYRDRKAAGYLTRID